MLEWDVREQRRFKTAFKGTLTMYGRQPFKPLDRPCYARVASEASIHCMVVRFVACSESTKESKLQQLDQTSPTSDGIPILSFQYAYATRLSSSSSRIFLLRATSQNLIAHAQAIEQKANAHMEANPVR